MIVIVGCEMVLGAVLTGFLWEGGHLAAPCSRPNWPSSAERPWGADRHVVEKSDRDLLRGIVECVKGTPYNKKGVGGPVHGPLSAVSLARRHGLIALESHLSRARQQHDLQQVSAISPTTIM